MAMSEQLDTLTQDVLLAILSGQVVRRGGGFDLGHVAEADRDRYLAKVKSLVGEQWAMPAPGVDEHGGQVFLLTTLGSHRLLGLNAGRYESRTAIECVDGKYQAVAR